MSVNRRDFLRRAAGVASAAALAGKSPLASAQTGSLPAPGNSGIEHIVVVMMENRSFDHLLGWLPGANGQQAGLAYLDKKGEAHPTYRIQITRMREAAANTTTARWMDGCAPRPTTLSVSATTRKRIYPSLARWHATTRLWIIISLPSWDQLFPTAFFSMRPRPIGYQTLLTSVRSQPSGTILPPLG
jgi:hypothetical protein